MHFEALQIEQVKPGKPRLDTEQLADTISARPKALGRDAIRHDPVRNDEAAPVRKFPQPGRDPRASALSLMCESSRGGNADFCGAAHQILNEQVFLGVENLSLTPASSPSLLWIQPVVFPS
jgi:hypothetical protein